MVRPLVCLLVRPPLSGLPLAAALPPLALTLCLIPVAGKAYQVMDEPEPARAGLRWVAEEQAAPAAHASQVVTTPESNSAPASLSPTTSTTPVATGTGLVWTADVEPTHIVAADDQPDSERTLTDPQLTDRPGTSSPLADTPVVTAPEPQPAIASEPPRPAPSGLVWTADDEPTPLVAVDPVSDPVLDLPDVATDPARALTQGTTAVVVAPESPVPITSGLRWEMDDEFSALVAANPASSPAELLAAAPPRIISVEMVVDQLELASHQPGTTPEDVAALLVQAHSPQPINADPSPADSAEVVVPIAVDMAASDADERDSITTQQMSTDIDTNSDGLQTTLFTENLLAVNSIQAVGNSVMSPQVTVPVGLSIRSDAQKPDHKEPSSTGDAGHSKNNPDFVRLGSFSLEPILLPDDALSGFRLQQTRRMSPGNLPVSAKPQRVSLDRPVRRSSRVAVLGLGLQFLSW